MIEKSRTFGALLALMALFLLGVASAEAARLDPSFGHRGTVVAPHGGTLEWAYETEIFTGESSALEIDAQGRILVGGGSGAALLVMRFLPDGTPDPSFGEQGVVRMFDPATGNTHPDGSAPRVRDIVVKRDGTMILVGQRFCLDCGTGDGSPRTFLIRLNEDGSLNLDFGSGDRGFETETFLLGIPRSAILTRDERILIAGGAITELDDLGYAQRYAGFVMRQNPDGTPDETFGGNRRYSNGDPWMGFYEFEPKGEPPYSAATSLVNLAHGRMLVGGHHRNRFMVMRLNADGKPSRSFGMDRKRGRTIANFGGRGCFCVAGGAMARDRRHRIVQVGYSSYPRKDRIATVALVRYRPSGKIDRRFGRNGFAYTVHGRAVRPTSIAIQRNGRILVTARQGPATSSRMMVARYLPNGKLDRSFFGDGKYFWRKGGLASMAEAVVIDARGRAVVAGGAAIDGTGSFVLKRFLLGR